MSKKIINIRVSEEEKQQLEEQAGGKSMTQYLLSVGLKGGDAPFAGENTDERPCVYFDEEDDVVYVEQIIEKFGSVEKFVWEVARKEGFATPNKLYEWVLSQDSGAEHPYRGYTVLLIDPGMNRAHLVSGSGQELFISDERENTHLLKWLISEDGEPYYAVGEVIGRYVKQ